MRAISEEYKRLSFITTLRIPVSEDHYLYDLFLARRKTAEKLYRDILTEKDKEVLVEQLNRIEDRIKDSLYL
jgi:hypothetical protein